MPITVLIVEDEQPILELIAVNLEHAGQIPWRAQTVEEAETLINKALPDVVLLDWMLPGESGVSFARRLRADRRTRAIPIIMLTARAEESDRIVGLEIGADDYLSKPFSPNELVARVRALLRRVARGTATGEPTVTYGSIVVDSGRHTVSSGGKVVALTAKEFLLLDYLLQHRGRVLSRDVLLTDVWGYRYTGGTRTVDVHVRRLREKLPLLAEALVTVKQFGYKLRQSPDAAD
jgi:two-component system, OmpR family, alkaline phosphatase synthesis response regulator PhoP